MSLHRCLIFLSDPRISVGAPSARSAGIHILSLALVSDDSMQTKVAQCFLLNGVIFLGSNLLIQYAVQPGIRWLLYTSMQTWAPEFILRCIDNLIANVYVWLWLVPAYALSVLMNTIW